MDSKDIRIDKQSINISKDNSTITIQSEELAKLLDREAVSETSEGSQGVYLVFKDR